MSALDFIRACESGDLTSVVSLHGHDFGEKTLAIAMYHACRGYHTNVVDFFLSNPTYCGISGISGINIFNDGLIGACEEGYLDLVKLMIENGANNFDDGLVSTCCCCGNYEIAKLMIEKGATVLEDHFIHACSLGRLDLVKLLIGYGHGTFCYDYALQLACRNHRYEVIKLLLIYGATSLNEGLEYLYKKNYRQNALEIFIYNQPQPCTVTETTDMEKIVQLLIHEGAYNYTCLILSNNFMFYRLYCIYSRKNPADDEKYQKLLVKHPFYILLVGGNVRINKTEDNCGCGLKMLPTDVFRQLLTYL